MKPLDNAILIDKNGFKIDIVAIDDYGNAYGLELNEGEGLVLEGVGIAAFMNKPQWNGSEWIETEPLPPQEPVKPPENKMEVLKARVDGLENINAGLLLENAGHQIKIQEQEKMNKEQEVTNANLLLEIAMLKGEML